MWQTKPLPLTVIRDMSAQLGELISLYLQVPKVIGKEHQAIAERSLKAMELAGEEKKVLSLQIESALKVLYAGLLNIDGLEEKHLSGCLKRFRSYEQESPETNVELRHSIEEFGQNVDRLLDLVPKVQVQIEMNKQIVSRFLKYYQESLKFWSDIVGERTSLYGAKGKRKTPEIPMQLSTEA